jgi:hypothetical protein
MSEAILLIDDREDQLGPLAAALTASLDGDAQVIQWAPTARAEPKEVFDKFLLDNDVRLIVTDYDLSTGGKLGFFGGTVVDWSQLKSIPAGDFSRGHAELLAKEPNLFELRIPVETPEIAGRYIAELYRGFSVIRQAVKSDSQLLQQRSPAAVLARLLGVKHLSSQFSQYTTRYGTGNGSLVDQVAKFAPRTIEPDKTEREEILTYIIGHLLVNGILRFPGPIVDESGLAAFLAITRDEATSLEPIFKEARYTGPFHGLRPFYWTEQVESILENQEGQLPEGQDFESPGEQHRALVELLTKRTLARDQQCPRCQGKNGGFLCPYSKYTVCQRSDCSVASSGWIPQGAYLARIEKDFYDEWAPILGM